MAIFNKQENEFSASENDTIIGASVKVDGNFKSDGNVVVEGMVQGSIITKSDLTVSETAKIKAEVETKNLFLAGEIKGNVKVTEKTELKSKAKILGNLETKLLIVEEGAIINGKCIMLPDANPNEPKENKKTAIVK